MKKMILDLDTGIDDAMALAVALGSEEVELIGVVGTYGNVVTPQGVQNMADILYMTGNGEIPVYAGEEHALQKTCFDRMEISAKIHGDNGLGEVLLAKSPKETYPKGVAYLIEMIHQYGKELTIVAAGPMTNLGKALELDPTIAEEVGEIYIMGGALMVPGNTGLFAEANIYQDPYAAKVLFDSGASVTMVGLDVTTRSVLGLEDTQIWRETGSIPGITIANAVDYYIHIHDEIAPTAHGCYLHDPAAVIAAIHPEWFNILPLALNVEQDGPSMGRTIGYKEKIRDEKPSTKVCLDVDADKVVAYLNESLMNLFG